MGAVGAVALAAISDVTREETRVQAFTITGMTIGIAFILGVLSGPMLAPILGLKGLFFLLSGLGLIGELFVARYFPRIPPSLKPKERTLRISWNQRDFLRVYLANFVLALTLNALFFLLPLEFQSLKFPKIDLGKAYLLMLLPAGVLAFPFVRRAERLGSLNFATLLGFALIMFGFIGDLLQSFSPKVWALLLFSGLFFFGYTIEQALLPAFLTQRLTPQSRGRITGVYNLCAFLGSAFGGILSGLLYPKGTPLPFLVGTLALALMGAFGLPMQKKESP
jgi:MFS family permease